MLKQGDTVKFRVKFYEDVGYVYGIIEDIGRKTASRPYVAVVH